MTDDSLDERLAGLESEASSQASSSLEESTSSGDESDPISLAARFWAAFALIPQVRVLLIVAPTIGESPMGRSVFLASLVGGVVVAECLLRGFGPAIASALWEGFFDAFLIAIGALVVWVVATGSSPPDAVIGTGLLIVSAVVTVHRFERAELG
ncbi:hypothetical protein [Natrinema sp. SYSU A 869]|uniref:hypothetical protein n=1 Tax=Natrinema sp. SYSU A 869 TaxID=2871694 RepID=UPI001CA40062|nr:hypothetical protein [Natrinema sp. SYSU A 869]